MEGTGISNFSFNFLPEGFVYRLKTQTLNIGAKSVYFALAKAISGILKIICDVNSACAQ